MKFLSDECVEIRHDYGFDSRLILNDFAKLGWNITDFDVKQYSDSNFLRVRLKDDLLLLDKQASSIEARKISKGYFAGWYLLSQGNAQKKSFVIFDQKYAFQDLKFDATTAEQADEFLSSKAIVQMIAKGIKDFDISKKNQNWQFVCDKMPKKCFFDKYFVKTIENEILDGDNYNFVNVENRERVNIPACVLENAQNFRKLVHIKQKQLLELLKNNKYSIKKIKKVLGISSHQEKKKID